MKKDEILDSSGETFGVVAHTEGSRFTDEEVREVVRRVVSETPPENTSVAPDDKDGDGYPEGALS
ncbi:hypothetical protein IAD21_00579 [Abditibacteriota bacterium]|nr:hypothetical protein IAD21_00579 [Abditibacteriota bacterium]